jgi:hypothetical protein
LGLDTKYLKKGDYKKIARFDFTEGWVQKKGTKVGLDTKHLKGDYKKNSAF